MGAFEDKAMLVFSGRIGFIVGACLCAAGAVQAAPKHFRVGAGCRYTTIKAALDDERANPGTPADFIWIARNQDYTAQDVQVHDQNVFIYGGVDDCADTSISGTTTLSGAGGAEKSVMTISGRSQVWLGGLKITQGDNNAGGVGGGINFVGTGLLKVGSSTITGNRAGYGGGINFRGTGNSNDVAELWINVETLITNNTATTSGGGIRIEGNATLRVTDPQVWIALNHADNGYGGGMQVIGPAKAYLGSPGYRLAEYIGLLYQNTAKYGGGLSINGGSGDSQNANVCLFATDPAYPVRIEGNVAAQDGGGIYLKPVAGSSPSGAAVEGSDYRITANTAKEGSAIYSGNDFSATGYDTSGYVGLQPACEGVSLPAFGAVTCSSAECNRIDGNVAQDISGQATAGSTLLLQPASTFYAQPLRMDGNQGAHAIRVIGGYRSGFITYTPTMGLTDCLLADNAVASDLVLAGSETSLSLSNCTIAGNAIGSGSAVVKSAGELVLQQTIVAQGQTATLDYGGGNPDNLTVRYVMSMETASLASGSHVIQADPLFVAAAQGNYRLRSTSPAIDLAPSVANNPRDLDGNPRDVDLSAAPNLDGIRDLGAYERQLRYCGAADTMFCDGFQLN